MSTSQPKFDDFYELLSAMRRADDDLADDEIYEADLIEIAIIKLVVHCNIKHCSVFLPESKTALRCVVGTALESGLVDKPDAIRAVHRYNAGEIVYPNDEGIVGQAFQTAETVVCNRCDESVGSKLDFDDVRSPVAGSMMSAPLFNRGKVFGVLNVSYPEPDYFSSGQVRVIELFADTLADLMGRRRKEAELRRKVKAQKGALSRAFADVHDLREQVKQMTSKDPLTGLHNRGYFFQQGKIEVSRACRHGTSLAVVMVDVDNLNHINERCGHIAGDEALKEVASVLLEQARDGDIFVRFGGEDFMVMLPETDDSGAEIWADRIRSQIMQVQVACSRYENILTASFGVTGLQLEIDSENFGDLIDRLCAQAAQAIQVAKQSGGNKVEVYRS